MTPEGVAGTSTVEPAVGLSLTTRFVSPAAGFGLLTVTASAPSSPSTITFVLLAKTTRSNDGLLTSVPPGSSRTLIASAPVVPLMVNSAVGTESRMGLRLVYRTARPSRVMLPACGPVGVLTSDATGPPGGDPFRIRVPLTAVPPS